MPSPLPSSFQTLYWAVTISTALFGITMLQGWMYFHNNRDGWGLRLMVTVMIIVDAATTGLIGAIGYFYFVENFGISNALHELPHWTSAEPFLMFPIIYAIQLFFAYSAYELKRGTSKLLIPKRSWLAPAIILPFATASFVAGMVVAVFAHRTPFLNVFLDKDMKISIALHTSLSAFSDIVATIFLTVYAATGLSSCVKGFRLKIKNLLMYVVTRGFLVSAIQLGTCIFYLAQPDNLLWTPFHFCMGRVYIITMLSMLNSRAQRKAINETSEAVVFGLSPMQQKSSTNFPSSRMVFVSNKELATGRSSESDSYSAA